MPGFTCDSEKPSSLIARRSFLKSFRLLKKAEQFNSLNIVEKSLCSYPILCLQPLVLFWNLVSIFWLKKLFRKY